MKAEEIKAQLAIDLQRLIGRQLTHISLGMFIADLKFYGDINLILSIKKKFHFSLDGVLKYGFDPSELPHPKEGNSSDFVYLHGLDCEFVDFSESNLKVGFSGGGYISVDLLPTDFEPFEYMGRSGPSGEHMEFYYVT
jgi:hypothetical protein